jgi:medium-chain acyl-[acyl-carrier-protein] hydrolase
MHTHTPSAATPWIAYRRPLAHPRLRLFCFPYGGGSAAIYRDWAGHLPAGVELCPVQLPGRERRLAEPPHERVEPLAAELAGALRPLMDVPFAFFGHSMGAVIGYELARELRRTGGPAPAALLLSGRRAPQVPPREPPIHALPDAEFTAEIQRLGGTPAEVLREPEIMEIFLPLLRADITLCERHTGEFRPGAPLDVPFFLYGGDADPDVTPGDVRAWGELTTAPAAVRIFPGDHFFLFADGAPFFRALAADLAAVTRAAP